MAQNTSATSSSLTPKRQPKRALTHAYKPDAKRLALLKSTLALFPGGVPRPEYPRPRLVRGGESDWTCLNGRWEFSFDGENRGQFDGWKDLALPDFVVVPFSPGWKLSCRTMEDPIEVSWYARDFEIPAAWLGNDRDVLLHFGASDYKTIVYVNGTEVGHNQGGHVPFAFDIAAHVAAGTNRVVLRVEDKPDPAQPRGKQSVTGVPKSIDYWGTSGPWQTVWLEAAPSIRIQDVVLTPSCGADAAQDALDVTVYLHAPALGWRVEIEVTESVESDVVVASANVESMGAVAKTRIPLPNCRRWSPDSPQLYGVRVRLFDEETEAETGAKALDEVRSYAGMRGVSLRGGKFCLSGEPLYLKLILDQGYWPDSGLTAPTDADLIKDIELTKAFGFNGARKHQKVEDPRWLYHCDRLGLLVWSEMANARAWTPESEEKFVAEWERAVRRDASHPCIVAWVPLNESWGVPGLGRANPAQHAFVERVVALTRRLDSSRPVIDNDGWEHSDVGDILALHDYRIGQKLLKQWQTVSGEGRDLQLPTWLHKGSKKIFVDGAKYRGQPIMLTEVGGLLNIPDLPKDQWDPLYQHYNTAKSSAELLEKYRGLMEIIAGYEWVSGFCYTQLTDIELEINGLLTYDRRPKIEPTDLAAVHEELFGGK